MARTWLAIRVELLGGGGEELWPPPGRVLAVGPAHTFADLARAIDDGFARWDPAHLCQFTLADGRVVTDDETGAELAGSPFGPLEVAPLVLERTKVSSQVAPGEVFQYVFDFGDGWTHSCTVEDDKIDPAEVFGRAPRTPTAYWGWGAMPDQYGRRWPDDSGADPMPSRPTAPHPMLTGGWPGAGQVAPVDLPELRGATYRGDVGAILEAVEGRDIDELLQHVGMAAQVVLAADRDKGEPLALSVANRLGVRGGEGDDVLAEDLVAALQDVPLAARHLPVDLSELASALEGDASQPSDYLDLETGQVLSGSMFDAGEVGEDAYVDPDADPDRWLFLHRESRSGWRDMEAFAMGIADARVRGRLEVAIQGRGAFRRFRDVVAEEGMVERWRAYSDERAMGRARAFLAGHGIRVRPPSG